MLDVMADRPRKPIGMDMPPAVQPEDRDSLDRARERSQRVKDQLDRLIKDYQKTDGALRIVR